MALLCCRVRVSLPTAIANFRWVLFSHEWAVTTNSVTACKNWEQNAWQGDFVRGSGLQRPLLQAVSGAFVSLGITLV